MLDLSVYYTETNTIQSRKCELLIKTLDHNFQCVDQLMVNTDDVHLFKSLIKVVGFASSGMDFIIEIKCL